MAKEFGHTGTLFIQAWKYKWSYRHEHCIKCWQVKFKHKGRWLCTSCWDKEKDNDPNRKEQKYNAGHKWHVINKPRKPREEWKKRWQKPTWFYKKEYARQWYQKWKEPIIILNLWRERQKRWIIQPLYKWKPIPFDIWPRDNKIETYEEYKERMRKFQVVKQFVDK